MAYHSQINYADDLDYLLRTGAASAGTINRVLNERMEKQQAAGENVYDDTNRRALAYLLRSGKDLVASDNVDYASTANDILNAGMAGDKDYEFLAAALAQRDAKLAGSGDDTWLTAGIDDGKGGVIPYNGPGSLQEQVADYLMGKKIENAKYPALSGGYTGTGMTQGDVERGRYSLAAELLKAGYSAAELARYGLDAYVTQEAINNSGLSSAQLAGLGYGDLPKGGGYTAGVASGGGRTYGSSGYTPEETNRMRRAARDNVGVTNAATRAPVQGENSSYVEATTRNAYRDGLEALREMGDTGGAAALDKDRENYEKTGHVGRVAMPEMAEGPGIGTVRAGSGAGTGGIGAGNAEISPAYARAMPDVMDETPLPYQPVGYTKWLADVLSPAVPGAVYDTQSRIRGAGDLYAPEKAEYQYKQKETPVHYPSVRAPGGPKEVAFDDTYADIPYDQKRSIYVRGYGPANDAEIQAMDNMGKLKSTVDEYGRESFYYDTTPKYRRSEAVR